MQQTLSITIGEWRMDMTNTAIATRAPAAPRGVGVFGFVSRFMEMREVARQRKALARLSPEQLRDIGLDGDLARSEADRPFWDAPQGWR
tara:strand:- start:14 stop:280 length:267 start_codon:yes stop_codon:yes gene_type:complete